MNGDVDIDAVVRQSSTVAAAQFSTERGTFLDRFRECLTGTAMTGSDLPHITGTAVAEFAVPLPPEEEQGEIVRRTKALLSVATAIEERLATAVVRTEKLSQAVLAKAFRGDLVGRSAE